MAMSIFSKLQHKHYFDKPDGQDLGGKILCINRELYGMSPMAVLACLFLHRVPSPVRLASTIAKLYISTTVFSTVFVTGIYFIHRTFNASPLAYYPYALATLPCSYMIHRYYKLPHHNIVIIGVLMFAACVMKKHHLRTGGQDFINRYHSVLDRTLDVDMTHVDPRPRRELALHWRVDNP